MSPGALSSALGLPSPDQGENNDTSATVASEPTLEDSLMTGSNMQPSQVTTRRPTLEDALFAGSGGLPAAPGAPQQQPKLSRIKSMLLGLEMGGVPGMIIGAADPQQVQGALNSRRAMATAKLQEQQGKATFENARAAHEVAMAHQSDIQLQALPQKLRDDATKRGFDTLASAKAAGYLPIASVALDQGQDQNSQNAMTALNNIVQQYGSVPQGLVYVHTGNAMTVLKLNDPNAALPVINQTRQAQGQRAISPDQFGALDSKDREQMAQQALNFTDPRDVNGMVSPNSLNIASMRLLTIQQQPQFNGKDQLVSQLQASIDHQKQVLDSGAKDAATRAGQAAGVQAQAAQLGTTQAKIAEINAEAGPQAAAAAQKSGAEQRAKNAADMAAMQGSTDALGNHVGVTPEGQQLNVKEYNSRADKFSKDYVQPLNVLAKTNMEFERINNNPHQTGAEKVTALLNAVGISGDPLKGKGFRISNDVINEHATARNIWESGVQKLNNIAGSGGPITSQQIADYTAVAQGVVHDAYVTAAQEARRQGLPVNFLPKATTQGQKAPATILHIYLDSAQGNSTAAEKALRAAGWQ